MQMEMRMELTEDSIKHFSFSFLQIVIGCNISSLLCLKRKHEGDQSMKDKNEGWLMCGRAAVVVQFRRSTQHTNTPSRKGKGAVVQSGVM
jgi:hypothetical protein